MDAKLRELERQLAQDPTDNELRRRWLMAKAHSTPVDIKKFYKVRCNDKWLSTGGYRGPTLTNQGTRFKTEAEALKMLLKLTRPNLRRARIAETSLTGGSVDIVCFEVHTIENTTKTVNLVDAAKQAELAEIRRQREVLASQAEQLQKKEEALLNEAKKALKNKVKAQAKKTKK